MESNKKQIKEKGVCGNFGAMESEEMGRNVAFIEPVDEVLVVQPPKPNTTTQNESTRTETAMEIDGAQVINSPSPKPPTKPYRLNLRRFESAPCGSTTRSPRPHISKGEPLKRRSSFTASKKITSRTFVELSFNMSDIHSSDIDTDSD